LLLQSPGTGLSPNYGRVEAYDYGIGAGVPLALNSVGKGYVGVATSTPNSTLEVNGSFATKMTKLVGPSLYTLDSTAAIWYIPVGVSGYQAASINLPPASKSLNRRHIIVNVDNTLAPLNSISSYINLSGTVSNAIPPNTSVEIISDGTNWLQIR